MDTILLLSCFTIEWEGGAVLTRHSVSECSKGSESSIPIFTCGEVKGILGKEVCIQAFTRGHKFLIDELREEESPDRKS